MDGAENKPVIRIHLDQQVTIDAVSGHEEVEDATVITEITGFDVEDDLYVLRGALSFSGFLRMEDTSDTTELPDAFDDRDVFATDEEMPEAPVMPFHHSLPFVLQVPVAAQQAHQRESGVLNVNPKIGQWNVHVLGEHTVHLRAELVIQGLSGQDGYVFRCGSQEEGAVASKLDQLLDQEESRSFIPPAPQLEEEAFEPPFEPAWQVEEGANMRGGFEGVEAAEASEDDWLIESPVQETEADLREQDEETEVVFTPDPEIVFPMPEPDSDWGRQLAAADRAFVGHAPETAPFAGAKEFTRANEPQPNFGAEPAPEFAPHVFENEPVAKQEPEPEREEAVQPVQAVQESDDADAFVLEAFETESEPEAEVEVEVEVEVERQPDATSFAPEPVATDAFSPDRFAKEEFAPERFAPEAFAREGFGQEQFQQQAKAPQEVREEQQPAFTREAREEQQPAFTPEAREEQQPAFTREAQEEQPPAFAAVERDEQPPLDVEPERTELETVAEQADEVAEAAAPVAQTTEIEAEYHFEDEVPAEEIPAVPANAPVVEAVEHPFAKSAGPKLSVSGKGVTMETDEPIKLSALLGDSRSQAVEALAESAYVESGSLTETAQLIRESLSGDESSSHSAPAIPAPSAPVYTSDQGHSSDSIWGDLLFGGRETKTTMKFRVVQEDESLPDLAEQYNTPLNELLRANNLQQNHVDAGQILYIPARRR